MNWRKATQNQPFSVFLVYQRSHGPACFVVDELQVVPAQIEKTSDQRHQQGQSDRTRVIRRPEHSDLFETKANTASDAGHDVYSFTMATSVWMLQSNREFYFFPLCSTFKEKLSNLIKADCYCGP